jgi:hypothetical protein
MATRFRFLRWSLSLTLLASLGTLAYLVSASTIVDAGLQAAKAGVVLDAQTRQPLAGVYVVARWLEQTTEPELLGHGGKMQGQCLYRVVVRTDSQGKYLIPATGARFKASGSLLPDRGKRYFWDLYTYSSGYDVVAAGRPTGIRDGSSVEETQTLETIRPIRWRALPANPIPLIRCRLRKRSMLKPTQLHVCWSAMLQPVHWRACALLRRRIRMPSSRACSSGRQAITRNKRGSAPRRFEFFLQISDQAFQRFQSRFQIGGARRAVRRIATAHWQVFDGNRP